MNIYSISPINFTAKKPTISNSSFTKDEFYKQISDFLNQKTDKEEYFQKFFSSLDKVYKQGKITEFTPEERKYINNLVSIADMSGNSKIIPDQYLKKNMEELIKNRK